MIFYDKYQMIRRSLLAKRKQLQADLVHFDSWQLACHGFGHATVDDISSVFDQATQITMRQNTVHQLEDVEDALVRLEEGTYGICKGCNNPVDPQGLHVVITANLCLECQRLLETSQVGANVSGLYIGREQRGLQT